MLLAGFLLIGLVINIILSFIIVRIEGKLTLRGLTFYLLASVLLNWVGTFVLFLILIDLLVDRNNKILWKKID